MKKLSEQKIKYYQQEKEELAKIRYCTYEILEGQLKEHNIQDRTLEAIKKLDHLWSVFDHYGFMPELSDIQSIISTLPAKQTNGTYDSPHVVLSKTDEEPLARISVSDEISFAPVSGFVLKQIPFHEISDIIKQKTYAANSFDNNHRARDNCRYDSNLIIFDIDNDPEDEYLALREARNKFQQFKSLIVTSKSHQKQKGEKEAVDRYRLIFLASSPIKPKNITYNDLIKNIAGYLNLLKSADNAAMEPARFYYKSNDDAEVYYSNGNILIDWTFFDRKPPEKKRRRYTAQDYKVESKFTIPYTQLDWNEYTALQLDDTKPIRCVFPEKHPNGDRHPSAFVGRHKDSQELMFKCVGCGSVGFEPKQN